MNKKKKVVNTSIYPDEVIERLARCFYPVIFSDEAYLSGCASFFLPFRQSVTARPARPSGTVSDREQLHDSTHQRKRKIRTLLLLEKVRIFRLHYNHDSLQ